MTILIVLLRNLALQFDSRRYPCVVYFDFLKRIADAQTPSALADALKVALAWKDGKVRLDEQGEYSCVGSGVRYSASNTKPNTWNDQHFAAMNSQDFFEWASLVRSDQHTGVDRIAEPGSLFRLWNTVVMPAFVLHCLNPRCYPIVDQHVIRAFRLLSAGVREDRTDEIAYRDYCRWWPSVVAEAGLTLRGANLDQLKDLDAGLWVLGKRLVDGTGAGADSPPTDGGRGPGRADTGSPEFKRRAFELSKTLTQRGAIEQASREFGIDLPESYRRYPGSHFDRWRKQGFE